MDKTPYFPQELPKFKSPEEELEFLRQKVAEKERELQEKHIEVSKEKIVEETIRAYEAIETEKVLPEGQIVHEEEAQGIVLRLRPEPHDKKIEELLGILMSQGIKNALDLVRRFNNPHVEDDFHRFLVQYLSSSHGQLPGIKEGTPIYKALDMKLFEITLPEQAGAEQRSFKEFISAMEQFYAGMQSVALNPDNPDKNYYTLEVAVSEENNDLVIYAAVPSDKVDLFEKQILAFYVEAKIREVTDDYNIFVDGGISAGAYAKLSSPEVFPIKVHEKIDHDPISAILSAFSKLKKEGEGAALQIVITPTGPSAIKRFQDVLKDVREGMPVSHALETYGALGRHFTSEVKKLFFGVKREEKGEADQRAIELITQKTVNSITEVSIRMVASAATKNRAEQVLNELSSTFNQFNEAGSNGVVFEKVSERHLPDFLYNFSFRLPDSRENILLNLKELTTIFHFPVGAKGLPQLKIAKASSAPIPAEIPAEGVLLGVNDYRGVQTKVFMGREDRVRHFYVIGQTGTGKTTILKNMIAQDIRNGDGCCFIDPHGTDIQDILSYVPKERIDDVIYFDPAYTARPMGLNMLEYDERFPEQKTFVVNELMNIFNKLFDMKTSGGPMFEQYFRNSALLVMEHPESGSTLLDIGRVLADKDFRELKLKHCKNPIIKQFWENAERTTGDQSLANFVPYITSKFDVFVTNEIMRPVIAQEKSVFNFRKIMDEKKILLVNLSKGRLGDINANLIGLIIVGKIQMAALSRVDMYGQKMNDFYLYIDEFQNVTTDSIASILSEARKYRLSLNVAHQYIAQLQDNIKNAVFGNVGSMAIYRVSPEDAAFLESKVKPTFSATDIIKLDNFNSYINMLAGGVPAKPFSMISHWSLLPKGNKDIVEDLKQLSYLKYGRDRAEIEEEIMLKYMF
jgi:hypothetical protein